MYGSVGGISLSSLAGNSPFSKEVHKSIQLMLPPEYRGINPPEKVYEGKLISDPNGICYKFAERPYFDNKIVNSICDLSYNRISIENNLRRQFVGEYSFNSTLISSYGNPILKELWMNFSNTEVTIPHNLDELPSWDIDLTKIRKNTDEFIWANIVHVRQLNPILKDKNITSNISNRIANDMDVILSDYYKNETDRKHLINSSLPQINDNLFRLAQSFARNEGRDILNETDFSNARILTLDNFQGFIEHPIFQNIKFQTEINSKNPKTSIIETTLLSHPQANINEIFEAVKNTNLFHDIYELQKLLDWLHRNNLIIMDAKRGYIWIGID